MKKKIYQKTRFSADIPLVKRSKATNARAERKSSSLGDTFRKIIGKFQGSNAGGGDRKKKNRPESNGSVVGQSPSRASSHHGYSSYQAFGNVDNHIPDTLIDSTDVGDTDRSGRDSPQPKQAVRYSSSLEEPGSVMTTSSTMTTTTKRRVTAAASPPSVRRSTMVNGSQTLDRNYRVKKRQEEHAAYNKRGGSPAQRYYLGEDPFAGSIYGKEKEYDGAKPFRRKYKNGNSTDDEKKSVK